MKSDSSIIDLTTAFNAGSARLVFGRYENGHVALDCVDVDDGEPICRASVNLVSERQATDEIAIKGWSENEGVPDALVKAGIIEANPVREVSVGFVVAGIYKLTARANALCECSRSANPATQP